MKREVIGDYVTLTPDEGKTILCLLTGAHHPVVNCPLKREKYYKEISLNYEEEEVVNG